ncbi:metalloregulator ArsR/SmtB family transcription factor [Paenibacillus sp. FSL W8-0186]|uniref:ArsR family transcriptional regulator n=1 Tax=Paenibacillus woosongensis TaxID=307580 RepID=A0A7X3CR47_9BACL|nr:metalloregulator ArsR/SmtB family transcription factor [Paenibacillus woosongensis]MUG47847.1 metalloregulator ArsR/SmtB family transcription factor [Paenibacillus woosongensis]GIP59526.1 ArsR family transcriptional regulator [Paenibacillus woosongensis]
MTDPMLDSAKLLKEELYKQLSRIGKSLSSDKRLEILTLLSQGPKTVEKLTSSSGMNFANVSRHLQVLLDAKLVKFTKKGTSAIYSLADPSIVDLLNSLWRISEKQLPDISKLKHDFLHNLDNIQTLTMDEVMEKLNSESILLLDLRPKEEFEISHIKGAISVPMEELEYYIRELPKDAEIIAYCRGPLCVYSAIAAQKLQARGFKAFRMDEGLNEWQEHFAH